VEDDALELVAAITPIELSEDAAAIGFFVDVGQQVEGLTIRPRSSNARASRVGRAIAPAAAQSPKPA